MHRMLAALLLVSAVYGGTIDGVDYTLQTSDVGPGYADYIWYFSEPVSAYTLDVNWYGYPSDYQVIASYGGVTQATVAPFGPILYLTIQGQQAITQSGLDYNYLILKFESPSSLRGLATFPSFTFTSLTDPPLQAQAQVPEPASGWLISLGLFGLALVQRWSKSRRSRQA